jgi:hypothetical protein
MLMYLNNVIIFNCIYLFIFRVCMIDKPQLAGTTPICLRGRMSYVQIDTVTLKHIW